MMPKENGCKSLRQNFREEASGSLWAIWCDLGFANRNPYANENFEN